MRVKTCVNCGKRARLVRRVCGRPPHCWLCRQLAKLQEATHG